MPVGELMARESHGGERLLVDTLPLPSDLTYNRPTLGHMADSLAVSHLRLRLTPEQPLCLPVYNKGNSLRGGFGATFRKLVCVDMRWRCADCSLRYTCPYTKVFNPFIPPDAPQFSGNQNIPGPFVFKPPLSQQTVYAPGAPLRH